MPTVISQDAPCRLEFLGLLSTFLPDPYTAQFTVDFGSGARSGAASLFGSEALQKVSTFLPDPFDPAFSPDLGSGDGGNASPLGSEMLQAVGSSAFHTTALEFSRSTQQSAVLQTQVLQVTRQDSVLRLDRSALLLRDHPLESEIIGTTLSELSTTPLELGAGVSALSTGQVEDLLSSAANFATIVEWQTLEIADWPQMLDFQTSLVRDAAASAELSISVMGQHILSMETSATIVGFAAHPAEWLGLAQNTQTTPMEGLSAVPPSDGRASAEMLTSATLSSPLPAESQSVIGDSSPIVPEASSAVLLPAQLQSESQTTAQLSALTPLENFGLNLTEVASLPYESLTASGIAQLQPAESLGAVAPASTLPTETLTTATDNISVWSELTTSIADVVVLSPDLSFAITTVTSVLQMEQSVAVQESSPLSGEGLTQTTASSSAVVEWSTSQSWQQTLPSEHLVATLQDWSSTLETLGGTVVSAAISPMEHLGGTVFGDAHLPLSWSVLVDEQVSMPVVTLRSIEFVTGRVFIVKPDHRKVAVGSDAQVWLINP